MDQILKEHERLEKKGNLKKGLEDVQKIIEQLQAARSTVEAGKWSFLLSSVQSDTTWDRA